MGGSPETVRVLHVDDESEILEVTGRLVESNHERLIVDPARSTGEAFERLDEVDCIVADYVMPEMDGAEFVSRVRRARSDLPVVFFTGWDEEDLDAAALEADLTAHVRKGVDPDQYSTLAERVVDLVEAAAGPGARTSAGE